MKRSVLTLFSACLIIGFTSCEKEVIEVVNQPEENSSVETVKRSAPIIAPEGGGGDGKIIKGVTDPNEEDDFKKDRKNRTIKK